MCGCGCNACGQSMGAIGDIAPMILACDRGGQFISSASVQEIRDFLNPQFETTNAAVIGCANLDKPTRDAWNAFYGSWKLATAAAPSWIWNVSTEWNTACDYSRQLTGWRETLARSCSVPGPAPQKLEGDTLPQAIKWAAFAAIGIAAVVAIRTVIR